MVPDSQMVEKPMQLAPFATHHISEVCARKFCTFNICVAHVDAFEVGLLKEAAKHGDALHVGALEVGPLGGDLGELHLSQVPVAPVLEGNGLGDAAAAGNGQRIQRAGQQRQRRDGRGR